MPPEDLVDELRKRVVLASDKSTAITWIVWPPITS